MEDEGGELGVGVCQGLFRIPVRDECLDDVGRPGVPPHKTCPRSGQIQPYSPCLNARGVAESQVCRFSADDLR